MGLSLYGAVTHSFFSDFSHSLLYFILSSSLSEAGTLLINVSTTSQTPLPLCLELSRSLQCLVHLLVPHLLTAPSLESLLTVPTTEAGTWTTTMPSRMVNHTLILLAGTPRTSTMASSHPMLTPLPILSATRTQRMPTCPLLYLLVVLLLSNGLPGPTATLDLSSPTSLIAVMTAQLSIRRPSSGSRLMQ